MADTIHCTTCDTHHELTVEKAKELGWKVAKGLWECPACRKKAEELGHGLLRRVARAIRHALHLDRKKKPAK